MTKPFFSYKYSKLGPYIQRHSRCSHLQSLLYCMCWFDNYNHKFKFSSHCHAYIAMHTQAANVEVAVLVPQTNPNIPWFYLYHTGAITVGYEFTSFVATEPPADDFAIPKECTPAGHRINRVPFYNLKPIP